MEGIYSANIPAKVLKKEPAIRGIINPEQNLIITIREISHSIMTAKESNSDIVIRIGKNLLYRTRNFLLIMKCA